MKVRFDEYVEADRAPPDWPFGGDANDTWRRCVNDRQHFARQQHVTALEYRRMARRFQLLSVALLFCTIGWMTLALRVLL